MSIHRDNTVAGLEPGLLGSTSGLDLRNHRIADGLSVNREDNGKDCDGENEIGNWSCGYSDRTFPQLCAIKGLRALRIAEFLKRLEIGTAGGIVVAIEADIAAERNERDLPACSMLVGPADQFGPKPMEKARMRIPDQRPAR